MHKYYAILLFSICLFNCRPKHEVPINIQLHSNWEFKQANDTIWRPATIPGNIHSDLLKNELINHPFISANEDSLQWISDTDWEYRTTFSINDNTLNHQHITLNFEGLDTYASVYLNDELILKSNNAFRTFNVNIKPYIKPVNKLRIHFDKTSYYEAQKREQLGYDLPEGNRVYTRKAQFQYGWDWGPNLNTSGIWKSITLNAWNDYKIKDLHLDQFVLTDTIASLYVNIQNYKSQELENELTYDLYLNGDLSQVEFINFNDSIWQATLNIKNPKLWWPHNLGEPYLYDIKVIVKDKRRILDSISLKKGLRTIDLVNKKDSLGESFYFEVNKIPVYMKGANYIPQNSLQSVVTDKHYDTLLSDVVDANMNMLRVWGGGIYENDIFYKICDEKGILIWQDFMFACAMYPGDNEFLNNISREAKQQVKRLRDHASIALWCGNNENSEGWHRWGWQTNRSESEKTEIWSNYLKVFDSILPNTVEEMTDVAYWETSPKYGRGNPKYQFEGDAHDWWVWHDGYPFEHFENNVPRFMSEFGFQSFPSFETIRFINQKDSIDISSNSFRNHQKHSRGFELIKDYMVRNYPVPKDAENYVYVSQLVQAYGITKGIEAHRRAKPYNMGSLYWQLNDCWPAISWSSIDYFGNWKALQYHAKKSFENVLISSELIDDHLEIHIVNDSNKSIDSHLDLELMDFDGNPLWNDSKRVYTISENVIAYDLDLNSINFNKNAVVLKTKLENSKSYHYFVKPKDLQLKKAPIQKEITKTKTGFQISLSSKTLQKNVFIDTKTKGHFSDNYFDLMPNKTIVIIFNSSAERLKDLKIRSLNALIDSDSNRL